MGRIVALAVAAIWMFAANPAFAGIVSKIPKPAKTPVIIEQGRIIYFEKCSFCHGVTGGGDGPAAEFMLPRPRNFQTNVFKFRTTASGALPTDEDLFKTISQGIFGTGMQSFDKEFIKTGLTDEQRWAVIFFIQTFSETPDFSLWGMDEEYFRSSDEDDVAEYRYNKIEKIGGAPPSSPEIIAKGKEVYKTAKCWQCHGDNGKGNGVSANGMKNDWGFKILPRDLTKSWKYKGGDSVIEIFKRFTTGMNGTPMPSFKNAIKEDDRWALAHFVRSLQFTPEENRTLEVKRIEGEVPASPDDDAWKNAKQIDVWLTGNVLIKPRWQNISIDMVKVKALFNDKDISFRVEWNDRFANLIHEGHDDLHQLDKSSPGETGNLRTYVPIHSESYKPGRYRDAVMLQFPSKRPKGTEKPHFLNGDSSHEVNMWWWRADYDPIAKSLVEAQKKRMADALAKGAEGAVVVVSQVEVVNLKDDDVIGKEGKAALEMNVKGFKKAFKAQGDDSQDITTNAKFEDGVWTVVFTRPLFTENKKHDVQFFRGEFIPLAINAWDGWNKDIGMQKSISTWYFVYLEKPMPNKVYFSSLAAALAMFGITFQLSRVWKNKS